MQLLTVGVLLTALLLSGRVGAAAPIRLSRDGGEPSFDLFDRHKGLASDRALKVLADRHGFVWVGGNNGLHRFDGRRFDSLDRDPNSSDSLASRIALLLADTSDALWIGNQDGVLQRLDKATGRLERIPVLTTDGKSPLSIYWIGSDYADAIWMHTDLGLLKVVPSKQSVSVVVKSTDIEPDLAVFQFDMNRRALYVTVGSEVMAISLNNLQGPPKTALSIPGHEQITAMASDKDGLWLVAGTQLWHWEADSALLRRIVTPVPMLRATEVVVDRRGVLWLASDIDSIGGLYRLDPGRGELSIYRHHSADPQSLRHDRIWSLALDSNDNLWIGTRGGVNRLRLKENGVKRIGLPDGRPAPICALHESSARKLLVSVCDEELRQLDTTTGRWESIPQDLARMLAKSYPGIANTISGLMKDGERGVWIAGGAGLVHWPGDAPPQRIPFETKSAVFTTATLLDEKRRLWAVTHSNGLATLSSGKERLKKVDAVGLEGILTSIAAGANESLWLGSEHGLIHYEPESGRTYRFNHHPDDLHSLSDDHVLHIYPDVAGRLWVGTRAGLNRIIVGGDGRISVRRYGVREGLPDQTIEVILNDASGGLWVGTDRGIARWEPQLDQFQSYTSADGVPDDTIRKGGAVLSRDGGLYFGTSRNLWRLDPSKLRLADPAPIAISSYQLGNITRINYLGRQLSHIKARYGDGRIAFQLASFGESRLLSYRLVGLEDQWRDMPADLSIAYHEIRPGNYRLQVRQSDGRGHWILGLTLPVEIAPPVWGTWWAVLTYATAAIAWIIWLFRSYFVRRRRRYEHFRTLRDRDERLRLAMSASGGVMAEIDFHTGYISQALSLESLDASDRDVTKISDYLASIHPEDVEAVERGFDGLQRQRATDLDIEYRRSSADDGWTWVRLRGKFIERLKEENFQEIFIGMIHDISQERSYRDLRQRGELLAVMSHEIRTPLNGVAGMIDLLDRTLLNPGQRKMLNSCKESTSILLSIINDFLDMSKIDAGMLELEHASLSPRDLVDTAVLAFSVQACEQQIDLDIYVASDVPDTVIGDWIRLRQVLTNLIGNAVKFTEHGGVEVSVSMDEPERLRLTVADTGIGIDEVVLQHLFQPFKQASASTTRRFGGTGLGLSIVKSLVEAMGGQVECESQVGVGTRFSVVIPAPRAAGMSPDLKPMRGLTVLVIAGSYATRKFVHEPLLWLGASVEFALDSEAAINRVQNLALASVDAIVITKRELADAHVAVLRNKAETRAVPILVIGGFDQSKLSLTGSVRVEGNPLTHSSLVHGMELATKRLAPEIIEQKYEKLPLQAAANSESGQRILLVEDNAINREVAERQLALLGYGCDMAEDGEIAWEMLRLHPGRYQLLITDGQMPRLDGYQLTERIRKQEAETGGPRLKIVMITASVLAADRERCLSLDMDGFLTKPLLVDTLKEKLSDLLAGPIVSEPEGQQSRSAQDLQDRFSTLMDLVRGDRSAFRRVLEIFVRTMKADLLSFESAMKSADRRRIAELAHRIKSACFQLGQDAAGQALAQVELASGSHDADDALFERLAEMARQELMSLLILTEGYLLKSED